MSVPYLHVAVWVEAVVASPCSSCVFCRTTTRGTCLCCVAGSRIWRAPSSCSWKNWDLWGRLTWTPGPSLTSDPYTASHWTCTTMSPAFQSKTPTVCFLKYFETLLMHLHVSLPWWWNAAAPFSIHLRIWWCFWTIALESQSWYKGWTHCRLWITQCLYRLLMSRPPCFTWMILKKDNDLPRNTFCDTFIKVNILHNEPLTT